MATTGVSSVRKKNPRGFMALLSSAVCEWFLIFLLFVDAAFSYLLIKFAQYCELPTPCLFCSRIGHSSGKRKHESYRSLLCRNHIEEISSLVSCHVHGYLADVRGMCEECFMPFSVQNKLNSGSYRLLVGKVGLDMERHGVQSLILHRKFLPSPSGLRICSCCNKSWGERANAQRLLQLPPVGFGASKANVKPPLPRVPGRSRFSRRESFKKLRDRFSAPASPQSVGKSGVDPLSHVGYTELKIHSDSESEVPISDDDDGSASQWRNDTKERYDAQSRTIIQPKIQTDEAAFDKQSDQAATHVPSLLDQPMQLVGKHNNMNSSASDAFSAHGLEELNWDQPPPRPSIQALPELISLDDVSQAPDVVQAPVGASSDISKPIDPVSHMSSLLSEHMSLNDIPASSNVTGNLENSNSHDKGNTSLLAKDSINAIGFSNNATPLMLNDTSPTKTAAGVDNEREVLDKRVGPLSANDSSKVEDMNSMPQVCTTDHDESQRGDTSISDGIHIQMPASTERNDSGPESLDGVSVSDNEGESVVDRLKKQIGYHKRCANDLYKELEEERNAAAIAANQAMAMINRLQEEKAALHMEALQYLRMMDEQAEYDMEALEKANDLLSEKEKEVQDLEAELEYYKNNFQEKAVLQDPHKEISSLKGESTIIEDSSGLHADSGPSAASHAKSSKITKASGSDISDSTNSSVSNFEDEKLYLVQWLKKLERRIHEISSSGACTDACNGGCSEQKPNKVDNQEDLPTKGEDQIYHKKEAIGLSMQNGLSASNGSSAQDNSAELVEDCNVVSEENNHKASNNSPKVSSCGGGISLANLENEIANFSGRLKALETDRDFLNHAFSALRNGNEGLQFIQEIIHQLQELRKIEFEKRGLSVH